MNDCAREELHDIGEQMDFVAYLVAQAADATTPSVPRAVDLHVPHAGLESLLRTWSARVLAITGADAGDGEVRS